MGIDLMESKTKEQMIENLPLLRQLYPNLSKERYSYLLDEMIPNNYFQLTAKMNNKVIGVTGVWIGHKIWSGKYLELDNVIVHEDYRSLKVGAKMTEYLIKKAKELDCDMLGLDVYTDNFRGIKFYMNNGFNPTGFHMIKRLK